MDQPHSMRDSFPPDLGMSSPSVIVAHESAARQRTKVPTSPPDRSTDCVGEFPRGTTAALDTCIRPLSSLSREEVAELARNAADNFLPVREANGFEPGTWQHTEFIRAWAHRQRELVEDAA